MNIITQGLEGCVVYIDDIIIYSDDWDTHIKRIRSLLKALKESGLVINLCKSDFAKAKVVYLGHEVRYGKVSPRDVNVKAILNFPLPKTKKEVRCFLGMCSYYRRFVKNFAHIAGPLTELLKKNIRFCWTTECTQAF